jgi:hypothetical protein
MKDPNEWKYMERLDFADRPIKLGNIVAIISPYYRDLVKAKVTKITPAKVQVQLYSDKDKKFNGRKTSRYSEQMLKLTNHE